MRKACSSRSSLWVLPNSCGLIPPLKSPGTWQVLTLPLTLLLFPKRSRLHLEERQSLILNIFKNISSFDPRFNIADSISHMGKPRHRVTRWCAPGPTERWGTPTKPWENKNEPAELG